MDEPVLDDRKWTIFTAIIKNYLETGEPVGSRTIARYTDLNLSSATIRNEMSDLEEMGLIIQPHTSAGRIPSDKGYRLYVDHLMKQEDRNEKEINKVLINRVDRLELALRQLVQILAQNTNYAAMITGPQYEGNKLKFLQLSKVDVNKVLLVIVVEGNIVRNSVLSLDIDVTSDELLKLNVMLNSALTGLTIDQINLSLITQLKNQAGPQHKKLVDAVVDAVAEAIRYDAERPQIYTSGANNIFRYPELSDQESAKKLITTFENKEELAQFMNQPAGKDGSDDDIQVYIGDESPVKNMKDFSVVTTKYNLGHGVQGTVGVIGPKRMDYEKVVGTLKTMKEQLDEIYGGSGSAGGPSGSNESRTAASGSDSGNRNKSPGGGKNAESPEKSDGS